MSCSIACRYQCRCRLSLLLVAGPSELKVLSLAEAVQVWMLVAAAQSLEAIEVSISCCIPMSIPFASLLAGPSGLEEFSLCGRRPSLDACC